MTDRIQTDRIKILSIGRVDPRVVGILAERFEMFQDDVLDLESILTTQGAEIQAIVTRGHVGITAALIERLPKLQLIANFGVGYDSVDVHAAARAGVVVTNSPGVLNDEMADFTVGLLLSTIRRLPQADRHVRSGLWGKGENFPLSTSLRGRHIGIAGMGRIGRVIARRLEGFDLPVSCFVRRPQPDLNLPTHDSLLALAKAVDTLIIVLPGSPETRNIVNAEILQALGPNGILINIARGSVVDENALITALQSGTILAAGLDVFAQEPHVPETLRQLDNVVLLPHIGTATHHTRGRMGDLLIQNVQSWFDGNGPITPVAETPVPKR
jgi:lactate dehydrogenase-like 2-hydroxyacid dehydrogenase